MFTGIVYVTGEEGMIAVRTIQPSALSMDKPLVVAVSRSLSALFAPWRREAYAQGGLFGMPVLVTPLSLAFDDPLTQLPDRRLLLDHFGQALLASARRKNYGAILFLDLDKFKTINDTRGHEVGDLLLIEVAAACSPVCAARIPWHGWAATSSWWCSKISARKSQSQRPGQGKWPKKYGKHSTLLIRFRAKSIQALQVSASACSPAARRR